MLEKEYKCLVTREQWQSYLCYMKKKYLILCPEELSQTNYYYDTSDYIQTLRIRHNRGRLVLQQKIRRITENGVVCSEEYQQNVSDIPERLDGSAFGLTGLRLLGHLHTKRLRFRPLEGVTADLDQNEFLGRTDYEVEIRRPAPRGAARPLSPAAAPARPEQGKVHAFSGPVSRGALLHALSQRGVSALHKKILFGGIPNARTVQILRDLFHHDHALMSKWLPWCNQYYISSLGDRHRT